MRFQETIMINAMPNVIFQKYSDVSNWSLWDREVKESSIDGNFESGNYGQLVPIKGPKATIYFSSVIPDRAFTVLSKLPFCTMIFGHELHAQAKATEVIHTVLFEGPLSFIFGRLIGNQIKANLPGTLKGLKRVIEK